MIAEIGEPTSAREVWPQATSGYTSIDLALQTLRARHSSLVASAEALVLELLELCAQTGWQDCSVQKFAFRRRGWLGRLLPRRRVKQLGVRRGLLHAITVHGEWATRMSYEGMLAAYYVEENYLLGLSEAELLNQIHMLQQDIDHRRKKLR